MFYSCSSSDKKNFAHKHRVSPNAMYKLGWEAENIVRSYNYIGKDGWKAIGGAVRELGRLEHVVSSFQTWIVCDEHEFLYERRVGGYSLHLRPSQRK
ncbi:hypothetical protein TNCV_2697641 [Trichonephila clavipes]|nr:hypothetical protein TNCV_2697641 [Trichonephila clavipes]